MACPVIIDDGGSIRIRQLDDNSTGAMDGLLKSPPSDNTPGAFAANSCYLVVRWNSVDGSHNVARVANALQPGDLITIVSSTGQTTTVTVLASNALAISIPTPAAGAPGTAQVYATQDPANGRRRYIVTNAGTIASVDYTTGGQTTHLFPAGTTSIFTMVHFGNTATIDKTAAKDRHKR